MAERAMRPCRHPGCPGLSTTGWCEQHTNEPKAQRTQKERWRGSAASRGYDYVWSKVRERALKRDCYLCVACLKYGRVSHASDVDHIIPFVGLDDSLRLDLDNLQSLCRSCHNSKTARQER